MSEPTKILTRGEVETRLSRMYEATANDVEQIADHDRAMRGLVRELADAVDPCDAVGLTMDECAELLARAKAVSP